MTKLRMAKSTVQVLHSAAKMSNDKDKAMLSGAGEAMVNGDDITGSATAAAGTAPDPTDEDGGAAQDDSKRALNFARANASKLMEVICRARISPRACGCRLSSLISKRCNT